MAATNGNIQLDVGENLKDETKPHCECETNLSYRGLLDLQVSSTEEMNIPSPIATVHKKAIVSEAKKLVAMAEELVTRYDKIRRAKSKDEPDSLDSFKHYMMTMSHVLNEALAFLESPIGSQLSNDDNLGQYEGVLRGMFQLIDLGSVMFSFGLIHLVSRALALTSNSYRGEKNYINKCLEDVELNKIQSQVDEAAKILKEVLENPKLARTVHMALKFDNVVREAWLEIESCHSKLKGIEEAVDSLFCKIQAKRYFYVFVKYSCMAGMILGARHLYQSDVISGRTAVALSSVAAITWSLSPTANSKGGELYNELVEMQFKHKYAQKKLYELKKRLMNHECQHRKIRNNHTLFSQSPADDNCVKSLPI